MRFEDLKLIPEILKALKEEGYTEPTSIQEKAIPLVLKREDVLGSAQTGTGKTAAFAIPIIQHLANRPKPNGRRKITGLVVTPTRELALQIAESFTAYGKYTPIKKHLAALIISRDTRVSPRWYVLRKPRHHHPLCDGMKIEN